jgi:hypothetical protein
MGYGVPVPPTWWWLGCHGGAGVTTLQAALRAGEDACRHWPAQTSPARHSVVLVTRSHASGLERAQAVVRQWAAGMVPGVDLLGLVVMADAPGRLPKPLRDLLRLVSAGVPRTWHVPWVEEWRRGEPVASHLPRQLASLSRQLQNTKTRAHV